MQLKKLNKEIINKNQELKTLKSTQEYRIAQIQRLSELSQPVQRDTTYIVNDKYAERGVLNMYSGVTITAGHIDLEKIEKGEAEDMSVDDRSGRSGRSASSSVRNQNIHIIKSLRTGEVMQLEARLEEESRKLTSGVEELTLAMQEVTVGTKALDLVVTRNLDRSREEAAVLVKDVDRMDHQGYLAVSELLTLRLRIMMAQREEIEELAQLRSDKEFFGARERQMRDQLINDMGLMKRRLKAEAGNSNKDFHSQHLALDKQLDKMKKKLARLQKTVVTKDGDTEKLEQLLTLSKGRYERLTQYTTLEMEGYHNEARMLKQKMKVLERSFEKSKEKAEI